LYIEYWKNEDSKKLSMQNITKSQYWGSEYTDGSSAYRQTLHCTCCRDIEARLTMGLMAKVFHITTQVIT
jgi:hypothetical protein